jgi:hypothetical protein
MVMNAKQPNKFEIFDPRVGEYGVIHSVKTIGEAIAEAEKIGAQRFHGTVGQERIEYVKKDGAWAPRYGAGQEQRVGDMFARANAALNEVMARQPESPQQADRIVDGHISQSPRPAITNERIRSYVQDKYDEIGVGSPRPTVGRVVAITDSAVQIERNDKSVAELDRAKLSYIPNVGDRVSVTYTGTGNATVHSLPERTRENGRKLER